MSQLQHLIKTCSLLTTSTFAKGHTVKDTQNSCLQSPGISSNKRSMPPLYATLLVWHTAGIAVILYYCYCPCTCSCTCPIITPTIVLFCYFVNAVLYFLFQFLYIHILHCSVRYSLAILKGEVVCKHQSTTLYRLDTLAPYSCLHE